MLYTVHTPNMFEVTKHLFHAYLSNWYLRHVIDKIFRMNGTRRVKQLFRNHSLVSGCLHSTGKVNTFPTPYLDSKSEFWMQSIGLRTKVTLWWYEKIYRIYNFVKFGFSITKKIKLNYRPFSLNIQFRQTFTLNYIIEFCDAKAFIQF